MSSNKKAPKHKPAGDAFFALGTKTKSQTDISKRGMPASALKRPAANAPSSSNQTSSLATASKKARIESSSGPTSSGSSSSLNLPKILEPDQSWASIENSHSFGQAHFFEDFIKQARDKNKPKKMGKIVCGAFKMLVSGSEVDVELLRKVLDVVSKEPALEKNSNVLHAMLAFLNRFNPSSYEDALFQQLLQLATNILENLEAWPMSLIPHVLGDSIEKRFWVDKPQASKLMLSVFSAFGDLKLPSESMITQANLLYGHRESLPASFITRFDQDSDELKSMLNSIVAYFDRRAELNPDKSLLKTLGFASSNEDIRFICVKNFDMWHQNGKLQRQSLELLLYVASNIKEITPKNSEILSQLVRLRNLKSKQVLATFSAAMKVIKTQCPDCLSLVVEMILDNEFSQTKSMNTNNLLQSLFTIDYSETLKLIAEKLAKNLPTMESSKKPREFIRELVKSLYRSDIKSDFNFALFGKNLFECAKSTIECHPSPAIQDAAVRRCIEIAALLPFIAVTPTLKEASQIKNKGVSINNTQSIELHKFHGQLKSFYTSSIDFINWIQTTRIVDANQFFSTCLYRLLCIGNFHYYSSIENWPNESDFLQLMRVLSDFTIDDTLIKSLLNLTLSTTSIISPDLVLDILSALTNRCLALKPDLSDIESLLNVKSGETIELLFDATSYGLMNRDEKSNTEKLAHIGNYWKAWELAFIWSCFSRHSLLKHIYPLYPTLRLLIQMSVTKNYTFPPSSFEGKSPEQLKQEQDLIREEELKIVQKLDKESVESLFEENSNSNTGINDLLQKTCLRDTKGAIRPPPEDLCRRIQRLNEESNFGASFCAVRDPDILFLISSQQGSSNAMSSITNLLASGKESIDQIPLQCLAQFLVSVQSNSEDVKAISAETINSIKLRLSNSLTSQTSTLEDVKTVVMFLTGKLCASAVFEREAAVSTLSILLNGDGKVGSPINNLQKIRHFEELSDEICLKLSECCLMDTSFERIADYIQFISHNMTEGIHQISTRLTSLADRANEQTESHRNVRRALLSFYAEYMKRLSTNKTSTLKFDEADEKNLVIIELPEKSSKIETSERIVSAMMTLLCESFSDDVNNQPTKESNQDRSASNRKFLMDIWFPESASNRAKVFRSADNAPIDLLPPELKLKMLAAKDESIVKAAIRNLSADQALEFIQSFGLTTFSASRLLEILNKSDLSPEILRPAVPYVKAYRIKGIEGAEDFLKRASMEKVKMEIDDDIQAIEAPDQRFEIDPPPALFQETGKYASLKFIIGKHPREIQELIPVSAPPKSTTSFLLTRPTSRRETVHKSRMPALKSNNPDEILKFLAKTEKDGKLLYSEFEIARLLTKFRSERNEIIEVESTKAKEQAFLLFTTRSPPISTLIAELTLTSSIRTVRGVIDLLLEKFDDRINVYSLLEFCRNAVTATNHCHWIPSTKQCRVLTEYVLRQLAKDDKSESRILQDFSLIMEVISETRDKDVLTAVMDRIKDVKKPIEFSFKEDDKKMYRAIQKLLGTLDSKFPGIKKAAEILHTPAEISSIRDLDKELNFVVLDIFNLELLGEYASKEQNFQEFPPFSILKSYSIEKPQVFARQLPLLSTRISTILQLPMRQIRERQSEFTKLMEFVIQTILNAAPNSMLQDDNSFSEIIRSFFVFFEAHSATRNRFWVVVLDRLFQLCIRFLEVKREAKEFFVKSDIYEALCALERVYNDMGTLRSLMDNLPRPTSQFHVPVAIY